MSTLKNVITADSRSEAPPQRVIAAESKKRSETDTFCRFVDVKKSYDGKSLALTGLSLDIKQGELITCLGPSGSGKTTTLMLLAGFQSQDSGEIFLRDRPISRISPHRRNFGVVFQNYALFPHMTVAENIAFPLKMRGLSRAEAGQKVDRALSMIRMSKFAERKPAQLSGGQQQRVALARALVFEPEMVLLDEPLAALDKNLREELQLEIRALHEELGITMLYVTHDQSEALTLSDRIAVFREGSIEQLSSPSDLYNKPATRFVASFIGQMNFIPIKVARAEAGMSEGAGADGRTLRAVNADNALPGEKAVIAVRPEWLRHDVEGRCPSRVSAQVRDIVFHGSSFLVIGRMQDGTELSMVMHPGEIRQFAIGDTIEIGWGENDARLFRQT